MAHELGHDDCVQVLLEAGATLEGESSRSTLPSTLPSAVSGPSGQTSGTQGSKLSAVMVLRRTSDSQGSQTQRSSSQARLPMVSGVTTRSSLGAASQLSQPISLRTQRSMRPLSPSERQFIKAQRSASPPSSFRSLRSQKSDLELVLERLGRGREGRGTRGRPASATSSLYPGWFLTQLIQCKPYQQARDDAPVFLANANFTTNMPSTADSLAGSGSDTEASKSTEVPQRPWKPCWKDDFMNLLNDYNYQHTGSYIRSTQLPMSDVNERPCSPGSDISEVTESASTRPSSVSKPSARRNSSAKLPDRWKRGKKMSMYSAGLVSVVHVSK